MHLGWIWVEFLTEFERKSYKYSPHLLQPSSSLCNPFLHSPPRFCNNFLHSASSLFGFTQVGSSIFRILQMVKEKQKVFNWINFFIKFILTFCFSLYKRSTRTATTNPRSSSSSNDSNQTARQIKQQPEQKMMNMKRTMMTRRWWTWSARWYCEG